jgi:hypothetical protein
MNTTAIEAPLVPWSTEDARAYRHQALVAPHRLHELDLSSDAALVQLLERHPRHQLQAFTMGTDPEGYKDWKPVDTTGASAADLVAAVSTGRLWYNIHRVHLVDERYRDLLARLYDEIARRCDGFHPNILGCTLIVSSPSSQTYYHADAQPNLLWQMRGVKRIWVYPAGDRELVDQNRMEDIFANLSDEEVPFRQAWDAKAEVFDLQPGQVISWPQNAPHRVVNVQGVNVSLSTVHETEETDRRKLVYCANRLLRRQYGLPFRSTKESGPVSYLKRLAYRAARRAGMVTPDARRVYLTTLRIDPQSPNGVRDLGGEPFLTEFSRKSFALERDTSGNIKVVPLPA